VAQFTAGKSNLKMHKKRFALNSISSLGYQLATIICGLILPNMILRAYGTEVNGLVSSITQFLRVISLSEFGMTAVIQSSLYEPLTRKDNKKIGEILTSSDRFFRRIALVLCFYVAGLCCLYPLLISAEFGKVYVITLILILSFNFFSQYMFAFTNSQLLSADQRSYIVFLADTIAIVANTVLCAIEIKLGLGIHAVKLTTAAVYMIKPIVSSIYVKKHYSVDRHSKYTEEPIKQKWNGVAQHLAYYVFTSTDVIVLTLFSTLSNVSVYSIYVLVLNGLKSLSALFEHAMRSLMGEIWALHDEEKLRRFFGLYEWVMLIISFFIYGCAACLIVPFVQVYTRSVHDANYTVPLFAVLITLAYLVQNLRAPYHTLIQSVGHYKETQGSYITAAGLNICISVFMVYKWGLVGVAIGTLISASIETVWQALYLYRSVLKQPISKLIRLLIVYGIQFVISYGLCKFVTLSSLSYFGWVKMAILVALIWSGAVALFSGLFYKRSIMDLIAVVRKK
jgi:O-antigen/teichoic acid export membrane protein